MMKSLSIFVGLILFTPLALAANDVTLTNSAIISVSGYNLTLSGSQYVIDSIVVNSDGFDVTLSPGSTFSVDSADRRSLSVTPTTYVSVTKTCASSNSSLMVGTTQDSGSITVTITPSTTALCNATSGGNGPVVGGGSGSLASYNYGPTNFAAHPAAPAVANASPVAQAVSTAFNRELQLGSKGADVTALQQLLAKDKSVYPEGKVSGFFGAMTRKAVRAFQKKYGISQVGRVGPQTLAKLNELIGSTSIPASSTR